MKAQLTRLFSIAAIGFFAVCVSAIPAAAQNRAAGTFTLQHEIRWQNVNLPAGDYKFSLQSADRITPMVVTGPNGSVFEMASVISSNQNGRSSVLVLQRRGGTFYVSEMDLANVGLQLQYSVPKAPKNERQLAQGPATEQVIVAMAK
jgi:hypothetical protein